MESSIRRFVLRPATTERRLACLYATKDTPSVLESVQRPTTSANGDALKYSRYATLDSPQQFHATVPLLRPAKQKQARSQQDDESSLGTTTTTTTEGSKNEEGEQEEVDAGYDEVIFRPVLLDSSSGRHGSSYFLLSASSLTTSSEQQQLSSRPNGDDEEGLLLHVGALQPLVRLQRERTVYSYTPASDGGTTNNGRDVDAHQDALLGSSARDIISSLWGKDVSSRLRATPSLPTSLTDEDELTGGYGYESSTAADQLRRAKYQRNLLGMAPPSLSTTTNNGEQQEPAPQQRMKRPREGEESEGAVKGEQEENDEEASHKKTIVNRNNNNELSAGGKSSIIHPMAAPAPLPPKAVSAPPPFLTNYLAAHRGQTVALSELLKKLLREHPQFPQLKESTKEAQQKWAKEQNKQLLQSLGQMGIDVSNIKGDIVIP